MEKDVKRKWRGGNGPLDVKLQGRYCRRSIVIRSYIIRTVPLCANVSLVYSCIIS